MGWKSDDVDMMVHDACVLVGCDAWCAQCVAWYGVAQWQYIVTVVRQQSEMMPSCDEGGRRQS